MFEIVNDINKTKLVYTKRCGRSFVRYYEFFNQCGWKAHMPEREITSGEYTEAFLYSIRLKNAESEVLR